MKIGLTFFPVRPQFLVPMAQRADELGYDSVWLGEHLVFPSKIVSQYPYGDPNVGPPLTTTPLFDPLITLTYIAAKTQRIQLGTSVYIAPLRHPVVVAKLVASLDAFAGGRVILGVGAGWQKEEFDTIGAPWEHRGARMEEMIQIMRRLWTEERVAHHGQFYQFEETGFEPKPARAPVPIMIGGETPVALKRAARCGDGWFGVRHTPESAAARVKELRAMRTDDRPFEISLDPNSIPSIDEIRRYRDAGVDRLVLIARALAGGGKTLEASLDGLTRFAETVMSRIDQ
ncbi:MAG: LLM class F420-dependent oxidoreductase [Rhodospirillaceae bacterium]|nr:MAG: LLM class F420-dependent oxidoreductase [Rhodospirillaceae bacterium]